MSFQVSEFVSCCSECSFCRNEISSVSVLQALYQMFCISAELDRCGPNSLLMDKFSLIKPKMCIYMSGRSNHCTERALGFYCPAVYCILLWKHLSNVEMCMFYKNCRRYNFNCLTISDLNSYSSLQ